MPLLKAILNKAGYRDVLLKDVNLEIFDDLLRIEPLKESLDRIASRLDALTRQSSDSLHSAEQHARMRSALLSGADVLRHIDEARRILRSPEDFYNPPSLFYAKRIFQLACNILSAPYPEINFGKYSYSSHAYDKFSDIERALEQERDGLFARYFEQVTIPALLRERPDVVGISIPYFSQLVPAFLFASLLKQKAPEVHIMLGGPVPTWGKHVFLSEPRFGGLIDSVAIGEADDTILEMMEHLEGRRPLGAVTNFIMYRGGEPIFNADSGRKVDLDTLPTPDFAALPLERYFAPERIICMMPTRGCYFNLCTFCNYAFIKLAPYRVRSPHLVAEDVRQIQQATGESVFSFESDVMLPRYLGSLADAFFEHGLDIKWHAVARFEKGMDDDLFMRMRRGGCVRLYLGMESVNQRILDLMEKGTDKQRVARILDGLDRAGIAVETGVFGKFPSETPEEAEETYQFVVEHRDQVTRCDVGEFRLLRGSPIAADPATYGLRIIGDPADYWYHLPYESLHPPAEVPGVPTAMQKIQALYPEVALVDVPEDLLYTARLGPNVFHGFFAAAAGSAGPRPQDHEIVELPPGERIQISRAYITNSGGVLFVDADHHARAKRPAFECSELPIVLAIDTQSHNVYPLGEIEVLVLGSIRGRCRVDDIRRALLQERPELAGEAVTQAISRLLEIGSLARAAQTERSPGDPEGLHRDQHRKHYSHG